ncbi:type I-B CRISPR-associated protein Cas5 [Sphingobacterium faecium]|uniref:type I-B CRISPR-associated protein Cas5b n=1 Tax=Sphingobacterium faecium TaxID=34087 RepID=UPI001290EA06|nr:type I-B CRISPR-associated protein Cas5b [Sphingobacterium faecium]MQP26395.1 type I-B CRISPR-associated protein Cas5 [Sphingobacterium faecium]
MKLISFDAQADFAFFRKPETNNTINLSYNIIHKPAILGFLGAVLGLAGYQEKGKLPAYYEKLKDVKLGVEPLGHEKGNFAKTNIKYSNTVGYANKGTNFLTEELTLINPAYRIYLLLDEDEELQSQLLLSIQRGESVYVPYLGKNEFTAWWEPITYKEYAFNHKKIKDGESVKIMTLFQKDIKLKGQLETPFPDFSKPFNFDESPFIYFERLPKQFDEVLMQYELVEFAYSTYQIKNANRLENLYFLEDLDAYVQLF